MNPQHVVITEQVRDSAIPVELMYVEMIDGVYAPIGLRWPPGDGPFPLVLFASGNGGGGMAAVQDATQNRSWTQEQFLKAGYAVAWLRYRAEVDYAYDRIGKLIEDRRQNRQLLNRGPLEYEDVISIVEYVKKLLDIDPDRIGYMGMSHGGEMAFKIASEYHGVRAMVASEPAAHEFLRLKPDATARINPATGLLDVERMLMREPEKVRARIAEDVAKERISTIQTPIFVQGRNSDELQGIFRVCYDLLVELGKEAKWESYEHDQHGFVFVQRNDKGVYEPDAVQIRGVRDSIAFFDHYLKPQGQLAEHPKQSRAGEAAALVSLKDVVGEIDMLLNDEWTAYLNRRTGELFTVPGDMSLLEDGDDLELGDWEEADLLKAREIAASSDWLALPTKFDIHEYAIMKRFCLDRDDDTQRATLLDAIAGKGAFRMFKSLIRRHGIEQQWYAYRDSELERFVANWLDDQGIPYRS